MSTTTLKDACTAYVEHMKANGQKPSTLGTIRRILDLLIAEMGEEKEVGKILPIHVDKFFKSEKATMQLGKDGLKPRAKASALQIRRVVRCALVYWHQQGLTERVALPAAEKHFIEEDGPRRGRKPGSTNGKATAADTEGADEQQSAANLITGEPAPDPQE